jgi:lipopolysaccharide/colanic/teichoic acid biosynthesis glycosyltransferase
MASGWRYRLGSVTGVLVLVVAAIAVANHPFVEPIYRLLPVVGHLSMDHAEGWEFLIEASLATSVVMFLLLPLYKPRPRRILDVWMIASRRTVVAFLALATIGYFDYTYRLPRSTLLVAAPILLVTIPVWFVMIRGRPRTLKDSRMIIVGDDPREIDRVLAALESPVLGYVSIPASYTTGPEGRREITDGSGVLVEPRQYARELDCLGGLSRLEAVLVEHDVDTAVFAFTETDREEFFGALATCHEYGVEAKIHREKGDTVLVEDDPGSDLVDIAIEPWDWQDRVLKRAFDVAFASFGLLVSLPVMIVIAVAIKLDSPGPVLYSQERTAEFGGTFTIYKFRSMVPESEAAEPGTSTDRVTRVGQFLRQSHLDEIPQLWSILVGKMSVVGPRAVWTDEEHLLEADVDAWRQRWFVRPGLTGLAQVNGASSEDPRQKLRYDVEYIRKQSFWFDLKIVLRQFWLVIGDIIETITGKK